MSKSTIAQTIEANFANLQEFAKVLHSVDVTAYALEDDFNNCRLLDAAGETVLRFRMYGTMERININVFVGIVPERFGIYSHVIGEKVVPFVHTETPIVGDFVWYADENSNRFIKNTVTGDTIDAPLCDFRALVTALKFAAKK